MKIKITAIVLLILSTAIYFTYSYTSEDRKYELMNEIMKDNKLYLYKVCSKSDNINIFENNLNDFTIFELPSVNAQKFLQSNFEIKLNKLKYYNSRLNKHENIKIISDCENYNEIFYRISMPIVSPNKKTVLIKITQDCNCMIGGGSGTHLYKKINGKWKKIKSFDVWIS